MLVQYPVLLLLIIGRVLTKVNSVTTERTSRPLIIGHRGAPGIYPENTLPGYRQAIADHADYIECDVFPTKDRQLVCLHDPYLSPITDVANRTEFADRRRTMFVPDYGQHDDWFLFDFTLDELKTLRLKQRDSFRDQSHNGKYPLTSFDEYVQVAKNAGRPVGIYPEIKLPELINDQPFMNGTRIEDIFLDSLKRHGYTKRNDLCFVQSFSEEALRYIKGKTELRLVMMVWLEEHIRGPNLNESKIDEWSEMYYGFGAWKPQIVNYYDDENGYKNWIGSETGLIQEVLRTGLKFHVYTFRNEDRYLAWDFKQDPINEYLYFDQLGDIEAYFTDFPGTMYRAFEERYGRHPTDSTCPTNVAGPARPWLASQIITFMAMIVRQFVR
ncbi:hypothetical protein LSH36_133g05073 [Paralvinella palmiformis]|uniref:glycerophosphodiester phosphodiesterase n=1 Tax=Paralvinella palmiformis TaxID=53620 RepID=A0AAD9JXS8_9ANNE|nr:hypothetical protein LSH36_133g05073 [Paralvinella palmiformis]